MILIDAADIATKPAVTKNGTERVCPGFQHACHIIGAVVNPLAVVSPAWHKKLIAHPPTIQAQLKDALRGGIDHRPLHCGANLKFLAQIRRRKIRLPLPGNCEIQFLILINRGFHVPAVDRVFKLQLLLNFVGWIGTGEIIGWRQQQMPCIYMLLNGLLQVHLFRGIVQHTIDRLLNHNLRGFPVQRSPISRFYIWLLVQPDPVGLPISDLQQSHRPAGGLAFRFGAVARRDDYFPEIESFGSQRWPGVFHLARLVALHHTAIPDITTVLIQEVDR